MPRVALHTLGCKLNYAETTTIGKQFIDRGFDIVPFGEETDVCVINTCSVTERADRECRQMIRRARRTSRDPFVVVTGCYAQLEPEEIASIEGVDLVLGAKEKFELFHHANDFRKGWYAKVCVSDIGSVDTFGPAFSTSATDRTRAYLKVQDGCDFNCTFCTIPLARGTSRSQSVGETLAQARMLVEGGYREIVLTGVNVGDYGKKSGTGLIGLLRELVQIDGLERLRISSIEPNLLSQEIIDFTAESPVMCNHFHIPLQSGNDQVLRGMRRRYTTRLYEDLIRRIRQRIPECGIGVDVIVGFPGETPAQFEETYRFLNEIPVSYLHAFTYSERPNTPAVSYTQPVEPRERFRRNAMIRVLGQKKKHSFYSSMIGRRLPVLTESECEGPFRFGLTDNYVRVGLPARVAENTVVATELTGMTDGYCVGVVAEKEMAG
ncbi:MAG: tRNA (N(6)-L-threonylcarbamoyladenosine(37)-C(2))-methylthiotransferase MtaB [Ignavibacteria bacterium]|nr:tRNA (N(6)-L-threonylcarbamoyladenosine(37)-C(2))-methylthiotransferase MtaB [Ignavibacteria bacterium]